jgi:hypothetical protein
VQDDAIKGGGGHANVDVDGVTYDWCADTGRKPDHRDLHVGWFCEPPAPVPDVERGERATTSLESTFGDELDPGQCTGNGARSGESHAV